MEGEGAFFLAREYKWAVHRVDLFSPEATHSAGRVIDFIALKLGLETFEADAVDPYCQASENEDVVVEPAGRSIWQWFWWTNKVLCGAMPRHSKWAGHALSTSRD